MVQSITWCHRNTLLIWPVTNQKWIHDVTSLLENSLFWKNDATWYHKCTVIIIDILIRVWYSCDHIVFGMKIWTWYHSALLQYIRVQAYIKVQYMYTFIPRVVRHMQHVTIYWRRSVLPSFVISWSRTWKSIPFQFHQRYLHVHDQSCTCVCRLNKGKQSPKADSEKKHGILLLLWYFVESNS